MNKILIYIPLLVKRGRYAQRDLAPKQPKIRSSVPSQFPATEAKKNPHVLIFTGMLRIYRYFAILFFNYMLMTCIGHKTQGKF